MTPGHVPFVGGTEDDRRGGEHDPRADRGGQEGRRPERGGLQVGQATERLEAGGASRIGRDHPAPDGERLSRQAGHRQQHRHGRAEAADGPGEPPSDDQHQEPRERRARVPGRGRRRPPGQLRLDHVIRQRGGEARAQDQAGGGRPRRLEDGRLAASSREDPPSPAGQAGETGEIIELHEADVGPQEAPPPREERVPQPEPAHDLAPVHRGGHPEQVARRAPPRAIDDRLLHGRQPAEPREVDPPLELGHRQDPQREQEPAQRRAAERGAVADRDEQQAGGDERHEAEVHRLGQDRQAGRQPEPRAPDEEPASIKPQAPRDHDGRQQHAERIARDPHPVDQQQRLRGDDEPDQRRVAGAPDDPADRPEHDRDRRRGEQEVHQPQAADRGAQVGDPSQGPEQGRGHPVVERGSAAPDRARHPPPSAPAGRDAPRRSRSRPPRAGRSAPAPTSAAGIAPPP